MEEDGVEEDEDQKTNYTNLLGAHNDYDNAIQSAIIHCSCGKSPDLPSTADYCEEIQTTEKSIEIKKEGENNRKRGNTLKAIREKTKSSNRKQKI